MNLFGFSFYSKIPTFYTRLVCIIAGGFCLSLSCDPTRNPLVTLWFSQLPGGIDNLVSPFLDKAEIKTVIKKIIDASCL